MNMEVISKLIVCCLFAVIAFNASAYEVGTHARLAENAYQRSVLASDVSLLRSLDVDAYVQGNPINPFGDEYYDTSLSWPIARAASSYVILENLLPNEADAFRLNGWLMRGAIREDDLPNYPPFFGENPQDDPDREIPRVLNHFYDPANQSPLTVAGFPLGADAPTWATGAEEAFGCPNCEDLNRRNHFTIRDARIAQLRALTGQDRFANTGIGPNGQQSDEFVRKAYWATLFRSLGDVVHLIQDMAQPQHTRNEAHTPANTFSRQAYELYTEARATGGQFKCANGTSTNSIPPLDFGDYPIPEFDRYSEAFSTVTTDTNGDITTGRGLADYSNRGFFTAGSNINNANYALPDPSPSAYSTSQLTLIDPCIPAGINSELLNGFVSDTAIGAFDVAPLSTRGLWNVPAFPGAVQAVGYSLSEDIYKAMGDLLIPRAVAYSAGFLNYFFRGKLDIQIENYNRSEVTLRFENQTVKDTVYSDNGNSQLIVTFRYLDNQGDEVFGSSEFVPIVAGDDVPPQSLSQSYTFTFPLEIPLAAPELELRLVYFGRLGNESDAVAIGYKPLTSPGFLVQPNELPADGIAGLRHIYKEDGAWKLSTESGFVVGNVDWKGHDPDDVLSFNGPQSRYFFNTDRSGYSSSIYFQGRLLTNVPNSWVHGVGIRVVNNTRHLTVISYARYFGILYVYSREFAGTYPNDDMYDVDTNPLGWKLLASYDISALGYTATPFFMNASGTEAQGLLGRDGTITYRYETRIKLSISGDSVTRTDFDSSGSYVLSTDDSRTLSTSITANPGSVSGGEGLLCPNLAADCLGYCTGAICGHQQWNKLALSSERVRATSSNSTDQQKIIAIDYVGDKEILATLEYAGIRSTFEEDTDYSDNRFDDITALCFGDTHTSSTSTIVTQARRSSGNDGIRFRVAETFIPGQWITDSYESLASDTYTYSFSQESGVVLTNEQQWVYSFNNTGSSSSLYGKLVYLDLRYNSIVYTQLEHSRAYNDSNIGSSNEVLKQQTLNDNYSQLSNITGALASLHNWTGDSQVDNSTNTFSISPVSPCVDSFVDNSSTDRSIGFGRSLVWGYMHEEAIKGLNTQSLQGYARDTNGNLFASQAVWEEQYPPPTGQPGPQVVSRWNYLTDGDPVALFGLTGTDPHFTRVGLY